MMKYQTILRGTKIIYADIKILIYLKQYSINNRISSGAKVEIMKRDMLSSMDSLIEDNIICLDAV